ncbi:MAG TPA: NifU family protein [Gemmatimonadales bacterium]|jgi:Fe-S cluster biogenesis protein NfuA
MTVQAEFERRMAVVDELVRTLETTADLDARSAAQELVRAVMDLNSAGLERMLQITQRGGEAGRKLADQFTQDGLVASLLLLYGLHPVDLETRIRAALEKTRPYLKSHGGNVELVDVDEGGTVRLRLQGSCHGCPSSAMTLKNAIEQAIHEAAPDVAEILVEGEADPNREPRPDGVWEEVTEAGHVCSGGLRVLS